MVVVALGIGLIVLVSQLRTRLPATAIETMAALAQRHYQEKNYDQAIDLYTQVLAGGGDMPGMDILLANALFMNERFAESEEMYRHALQKGDAPPATWLNLGLTLFKMNRWEEARGCYQQFLSTYGKQNPPLATRATHALALIDEQMARQRTLQAPTASTNTPNA